MISELEYVYNGIRCVFQEHREIEGTDGRYFIRIDGQVLDTKKSRYLKVFTVRNDENHTGYYAVNINSVNTNSKMQRIHRLLASAYIPNPNKEVFTCVDHINKKNLDNSLSNLRWATPSQNSSNRTKKKNASSAYMGVYLQKQKGKQYWVARLNGRHIGCYQTSEEAAIAYNNVARKAGMLHLNTIPETHLDGSTIQAF